MLVPGPHGGEFDSTARAVAKALQDANLARNVEVTNVAGGSGVVGTQRFANERNKENLLLQMGLGLVGAIYTNKSQVTLDDLTPVAKLIEEAQVIVVPANSPYQTIDQLISAWKANPRSLAVGGGSAPGGPDHLTSMVLAQTVGVDPKQVNFVSYENGGELLPALLGGNVAFGATGVAEVEEQAKAGKVKVLAVTSEQKVEGIDAPALKELGVDMIFTNWRGVVAPGGITVEQRQQMVGLITKLHDSQQWKDALTKNGWTDAFQAGPEFEAFLKSENQQVADVLGKLGLA
jgi:putative tricarboxylic transport membrane protein